LTAEARRRAGAHDWGEPSLGWRARSSEALVFAPGTARAMASKRRLECRTALRETSSPLRSASPPSWSAQAHAEDARVQLDTNDPRIEVFDRTNQVAMVPVRSGRSGTSLERTSVYASLCASTPCAKDLTIGDHWLALSLPGGKAR